MDKIKNIFKAKNLIKRKQAIILLLIVSSVALALILVESALIIAEIRQYRKNSDFEFYKEMYSDERNKPYLFGHKSNINVHVLNEGVDFTFETNSTGLREQKDYEDIEKSIVFLGDSVIEGSPVDNKDSIDSIFENKTGIVSLNFGLGSANTVQEYYWLVEKYKAKYNIKLIILGFTLNDFEQNDALRYFDPKVGNWKLYDYLSKDKDTSLQRPAFTLNYAKSIFNRSKIVNLVNQAISKDKIQNSTYAPYSSVTQLQKDLTRTYVKKINEFSKLIGSNFMVVIFPARDQLTANYSSQKKAQDALVEILEQEKIAHIDLYDFLKEKQEQNKNVVLFHDNLHFTKYGYELIGQHLVIQIPKIFPKIFKK